MGDCFVLETLVVDDKSSRSKMLDGCSRSVVLEKYNVELWGIIVCSPCLKCGVFILLTLIYYFLVFVVFSRGEHDFVDILGDFFQYHAVSRVDLKTVEADVLFTLF